ncbi:MAG TPA: hypothetical protein VHT91_04900 [Kofleriaceae bacterium]|jgi:FxsC-like protein|nr:hypothetical protein [Kofleriaceae bacterium]
MADPDQPKYPDYLYFVSYARDDFYIAASSGLVEDPYLQRFFDGLREAVRSKAGRQQKDRVDFRDTQQIDLGKQWRPEVLDGLQSCRVVLALYTPTFFGRPECGIEVGFMQRRRRHTYADDQAPHDFILPVIWEIPAQIPAALSGLNYFHADLPASYKRYGLRVLARQQRFADDFDQCIEAIASQIDKVGKLGPLPKLPAPPNLATLPNVFATPNAADAAAQPEPIKGPNGVRFAYIVASKAELTKKGYQACYGSRGEEWQPWTTDDRMIGILAPRIATDNRFIPYVINLADPFASQLSQAQKENTLIVLLVDAWSGCAIARYRTYLQEYDQYGSVYSAALVVWNDQDTDVAAQRDELKKLFQYVVLPVNHTRSPPYYHNDIKSVAELEASLQLTLDRLRMDIATKATVFRALEAIEFAARPGISGVPSTEPQGTT